MRIRQRKYSFTLLDCSKTIMHVTATKLPFSVPEQSKNQLASKCWPIHVNEHMKLMKANCLLPPVYSRSAFTNNKHGLFMAWWKRQCFNAHAYRDLQVWFFVKHPLQDGYQWTHTSSPISWKEEECPTPNPPSKAPALSCASWRVSMSLRTNSGVNELLALRGLSSECKSKIANTCCCNFWRVLSKSVHAWQ